MEKNHSVIISGPVLENRPVGAGTYLMTLKAPEVAQAAQPGQFVKLRSWPAPERGGAPLLDRPFSIHRLGPEGLVSVLYRVVGPGTEHLSQTQPGAEVKISGPLGRGLDQQDLAGAKRLYLAAGGIGLGPMALVRDRLKLGCETTLFYGERLAAIQVRRDWLATWADDFQATVEDGLGYGRPGRVTEALEEALRVTPAPIFCCGPAPMLAAVAGLGARYGVRVLASVEARMACGLGVCLTCSLPLKDGGRFRACQDGPVFEAALVDWEKLK